MNYFEFRAMNCDIVLAAEGPRFEFYQAVRLLEERFPEAESVGSGVLPDREASNRNLAARTGHLENVVAGVRGDHLRRPVTPAVEIDLPVVLVIAAWIGAAIRGKRVEKMLIERHHGPRCRVVRRGAALRANG